METRASFLIIGTFVIGMIALGFGFIYWMNNASSGANGVRYNVIFEGSVQGLASGSPVLFNGLRVGEIENLEIMLEDTRKVLGLISVRAGTPVRETSRAKITQQGLAGVVALEITPGTPESPMLQAAPGETYATIQADFAGSGSLLSAAPEALGQAQALLARLNDLIANNERAISQTIRNVESFTAVLDAHREDISAIITDTRDLSGRFSGIAEKLENTVDKLSEQLGDGDQSLVAQAQQAVQSFRRLAERLETSLGDRADGMTASAQRGLKEFELFMRNGKRLAESLDRMVQRLEQNPSSLLLGGSQVPEYTPAQ